MINEQLLITEPPSGNLILGDETLDEVNERKKHFNKMKLLEYSAEDIVDVEPLVYPNSKKRGTKDES